MLLFGTAREHFGRWRFPGNEELESDDQSGVISKFVLTVSKKEFRFVGRVNFAAVLRQVISVEAKSSRRFHGNGLVGEIYRGNSTWLVKANT